MPVGDRVASQQATESGGEFPERQVPRAAEDDE
jgi:hypothetical protein